MAKEDTTLRALHTALGKELLKRIEGGTATAAELAAASKFLRDNEIGALIEDDATLQSLAAELPFAAEDEEAMRNVVRLNQ